MSITEQSEQAEVAAARVDVESARRALAQAHVAVIDAHATPGSELGRVEEAASIRVAWAERRVRDADSAKVAGDRRRRRGAIWREILHLRPRAAVAVPLAPGAHVPMPGVRRATVAFLKDGGAHDEGEDLHPARLNTAEAELEEILESPATEETRKGRDA